MTTDDDLDKTLLMLSNLGRTALEAVAFTALRTAKKHEAAVALAEADLDMEDRIFNQAEAWEAHSAALAKYRLVSGR